MSNRKLTDLDKRVRSIENWFTGIGKDYDKRQKQKTDKRRIRRAKRKSRA